MAVGAKHFGRKSPLTTHNLPAEMLRPDDILVEINVGTKHFGSQSPLTTHNLPAEMLRPDDIFGRTKSPILFQQPAPCAIISIIKIIQLIQLIFMTTIAPVTTAAKLADYFIWFANDVGSYLSNQKLQKLLYYAQAWYLAFEDTPLFEEDFEAWMHGPTIPALFYEYKEQFGFKPILKEVEKPEFPEDVQKFLDDLFDEYFFLDAYELELMVRREDPWINARGDLPKDEPSHAIITKELMRNFYKTRVIEEE